MSNNTSAVDFRFEGIGNNYDSGDIAWMLVSTSLVFFMIPGVGFFYSGMVRDKNALSFIVLSILSLAIVSIQVWFSQLFF
ncbi:Ammonium transporter [endosymbiont GvMRE of Glomus versiforme]|nr:Ammonium transporter [endosymbiont GvMRE of Glomus versiforme]